MGMDGLCSGMALMPAKGLPFATACYGSIFDGDRLVALDGEMDPSGCVCDACAGVNLARGAWLRLPENVPGAQIRAALGDWRAGPVGEQARLSLEALARKADWLSAGAAEILESRGISQGLQAEAARAIARLADAQGALPGGGPEGPCAKRPGR